MILMFINVWDPRIKGDRPVVLTFSILVISRLCSIPGEPVQWLSTASKGSHPRDIREKAWTTSQCPQGSGSLAKDRRQHAYSQTLPFFLLSPPITVLLFCFPSLLYYFPSVCSVPSLILSEELGGGEEGVQRTKTAYQNPSLTPTTWLNLTEYTYSRGL